MNPLNLFRQHEAATSAQPHKTEPTKTLEDVLAELTRFGRPRLHCHDDLTWSCNVDMNTNASGAEFKVRSDFSMPSPMLAALQCQDRVRAAVRAVGGAA